MKLDARVVIVGRMNVGKSSLFNRLSTKVKSIAFDYAGVTRDFIKDTVCWQSSCFEIIDTGGVSLKKAEDVLTEKVRQQALELIETADIVVMVVDGSTGPTVDDHEIAKLLHKAGKNTLLVVNKMDINIAQEQVYDFNRLGFATVIPISCERATGIGDLLDAIVAEIPHFKGAVEVPKPEYKVVLLGKPNVGKSSLMNALLQKERAMVFDEPGTTREAISERIAFHQEDILITDTPGIRRKRAVDEPLEGLMVKSALHAVKHADIVLLLVDSSQGGLTDQELKLAFYAFTELHKALIILFNKSDLVTEEKTEDRAMVSSVYKFFLKKIEQLDISCLTGKNIGRIVPLVNKVWQRHSQQFSAAQLTLICQESLHKKPLYHKSELLKLFRVRQVKAAPISLLMIVNKPTWFGPTQLGYFDTILRRNFELKSVPLVFMPRTN